MYAGSHVCACKHMIPFLAQFLAVQMPNLLPCSTHSCQSQTSLDCLLDARKPHSPVLLWLSHICVIFVSHFLVCMLCAAWPDGVSLGAGDPALALTHLCHLYVTLSACCVCSMAGRCQPWCRRSCRNRASKRRPAASHLRYVTLIGCHMH